MNIIIASNSRASEAPTTRENSFSFSPLFGLRSTQNARLSFRTMRDLVREWEKLCRWDSFVGRIFCENFLRKLSGPEFFKSDETIAQPFEHELPPSRIFSLNLNHIRAPLNKQKIEINLPWTICAGAHDSLVNFAHFFYCHAAHNRCHQFAAALVSMGDHSAEV